MELLRISIENVLFHISELFTYLNKVVLLLGQRSSDITEDALYSRGLAMLLDTHLERQCCPAPRIHTGSVKSRSFLIASCLAAAH